MYQSWQIKAGMTIALRYEDVRDEAGVAISMIQRIEAAGRSRCDPGERKTLGTFDGEAVARIVELIERRGGVVLSKNGRRIELAD